jgi:predicted transcriptional regulator
MNMSSRRSPYEIYWEILVYCKTPRSYTSIINRCDLNSKIGQEYLDFLKRKGYLEAIQEGERTSYRATVKASEYIALFTRLYQSLFDTIPGFKL